MHCQNYVLQSRHLFSGDCHFSFCSLLTFLWPYGHPSCKSGSVFCLAHPECWDSCWSSSCLSIPNGPLYGQSQQRSNFCWRGLWQKSGMQNSQLVFGLSLSFTLLPQHNHMSSERLSEIDVWWVCRLEGSGVIFCFLIISRSGRYESQFLQRQLWKLDIWLWQ